MTAEAVMEVVIEALRELLGVIYVIMNYLHR